MLAPIQFAMRHPLCRHHKLATLSRIVRWQLASLLLGAETVVPFTASTRLVMKKGLAAATANFYCGLHEFDDMAFVLHFLRPEDTFVDVGANIGAYTILASGHVGARGIAFEPVPVTFRYLMDNIRINGVDNLVRARNVGVAAEAGDMTFTCRMGSANHVVADPGVESDTITIGVVTLDDALSSTPADCMKIDVEGFESSVIAGAQETLRHPNLRAVVMELNGLGRRYGFDDDRIDESMRGFGFLPYSYDPLQRQLREIGTANSVGNTLYLRDLPHVRGRISTAPSVQLPWRSF